ncbi:MAG: hypothetical protein ACLQSR_17090 [Limisphaerales bacterium]
MNEELEALILAYEAVSASRDVEAEQTLQIFEAKLDEAMNRHPGISRDVLRKSIIKAHRQWALKPENKPPAIPPRA